MRRILTLFILSSAIAGCDSRDGVQPDPTLNEPATRTVQPWTPVTVPAELAAQFSSTMPTTASTSETTTAPATTAPLTSVQSARGSTSPASTSRPANPLTTPESSLRHFLSLLETKQVTSMDTMTAMMVEPPPDDQLVPKLNRLRRLVQRGAKMEIVGEPFIRGAAAGVVYRTTDSAGRSEFTPVLLLQLYDRWKIVMGELTPKKYTPGEKEDMVTVMRWAQERSQQLTTAAASRPAGSASTKPSTPGLPAAPTAQ